jgi:hypothetical protein
MHAGKRLSNDASPAVDQSEMSEKREVFVMCCINGPPGPRMITVRMSCNKDVAHRVRGLETGTPGRGLAEA